MFDLLRNSGKPRLLEHVAKVRDAAVVALGDMWNNARFEAQRTRIEQQFTSGRLHEALEGAQELLRQARAAGEAAYQDADYDLAGSCFLLARVLKTAGASEQALPLLNETLKRFETIAQGRNNKAAERMASVCLSERGDCLLDLGRLDQAAAAYEDTIRRAEKIGDARQVAVAKAQLGSVRMMQGRYKEALDAYGEACERFTRLDEPGSVAVIWHQTGIVYQEAKQPEAAEDAFRKSLAINVRLGNVATQATALNQLGNLYDGVLGRPEDAAAFYRQAADKRFEIGDLVGEGRARNNLAETLCKLHLLDEARQEICRAIECKQQFGHAAHPWTSWSILAEIETAEGRVAEASEAKREAIVCYLAYRRDGGEIHDPPGRICLAVTQYLLAGDTSAAASFLEELAANPAAAWLLPLIKILQAIATGSRDCTLAEGPDLHYSMAAEILFLLETLEKSSK